MYVCIDTHMHAQAHTQTPTLNRQIPREPMYQLP